MKKTGLFLLVGIFFCVFITAIFARGGGGRGRGRGGGGGRGRGHQVQARLDLNYKVKWYKDVPSLKFIKKSVSITDMNKMHGHICYSSAKIYRVLQEGIKSLYKKGAKEIIPDNNDIEVLVSTGSPCVRDCVWKIFDVGNTGVGMRPVSGIRGREFIIQSRSLKKSVLVQYVPEPPELSALKGTTRHNKEGKKLREKLFKRQLLGPTKGLLSVRKSKYRP